MQTHLVPTGVDPDAFTFMSSEVSREKPIDYAHMAKVLIEEKERGGYPIWVTGPALVHSRARSDMAWFIANGYVGALLAGNAVAVHDIEASIYGTTLGMSEHGRDHAGRSRAPHARDQPRARRRFDRQRGASRESSRRHHVLVRQAQRAVRAHRLDSRRRPAARRHHRRARRRRTRCDSTRSRRRWRSSSPRRFMPSLQAICCRRSSQQPDGTMRELATICVDSSEFVVSKLKDRGTHQAFGVVTNAQDFMHILRLYVERGLAVKRATPAATSRAGAAMTILTETRERFLRAIAAQVAPERIAEIHFFQPIKQGGVESGVAVVVENAAPGDATHGHLCGELSSHAQRTRSRQVGSEHRGRGGRAARCGGCRRARGAAPFR